MGGFILNIVKSIKNKKKINEFIDLINNQKKLYNDKENFYLFNSSYGEELINGAIKRSKKECNPYYVEYCYDLLKEWDNYGNLPKNISDLLENLINDSNYHIGIHRTGGYGMIEVDDIFSSELLHDIFQKGLYITGDLSSGVDHKGEIIHPNKNISPLNNMLEVVMLCKSSYKRSTGGVITAIPSKYVTSSYKIKDGCADKVYYKVDNQWTLKPEYLVGFVSQNEGNCKFYTKNEILNNYNKNKSK